MENEASSFISLSWQCPKRVSASRRIKNIPIDVYEEIFSWLRPCVDLDMDLNSQQKIFARLASVCRYFAYYAICEMCCYLDFDGKERCPRPPTPTGPWCTGIIKRVQPMETLRAKVKECNIHNWIPTGIPHQSEVYQVASTFLKRFPLVLLRLDNLRILTLSETPISYFLLQAVGRLRSLEQLVIHKCCVYDQGPKEAIFGTHETPFPALHQLTIADVKLEMEAVYKDAFCVLGSVATLRSLVISSCLWLRFLLPHISPHLVSLEGNFSAIPLDTFLQFVNAHAALKDLAIHFQPLQRYPSPQFGPAKKQSPYIFSYATLDLGQDVLPNLRSFNGPLSLAPKFIRSRPVTRLAIGSHLPTSLPFPVLNTRVPLAFSQGFHGSAFLHRDTYVAIHNWHDYRLTRDGSDDIWDDLKTIGGDIQELFVRFDDTKLPVTTLSSCFPNLVRLQLELCWDDKSVDPNVQEEILSNLAKDLKNFKHLKLLSLRSICGTTWCFLSAGDQHNFVHRVFHECCPTLLTVLFSPSMVWHLRTPSPRMAECHCELELLWPKYIRQELGRVWELVDHPKRVHDWKGKLADLFDEAPPELASLES